MNALARSSLAGRGRWGFGLSLAALVMSSWLSTPEAARADNIDERLLKAGIDCIQELQKRGYKNVGVLKFLVKQGEKDPTFDAGLLNANMATRLEYSLILANTGEKAIGIVRDASQAACKLPSITKNKQVSYGQADIRKALFAGKYPLAWGKDEVEVDAFLTGLVAIDANFKKTTVVIEAFDRNDNSMNQLVKFSVSTDRQILSDTGQSFSLVKRALKDGELKKRGDELDEEAVKDAEQRSQGTVPNIPDSIENLLGFEVLYNGVPQNLVAAKDGSKRVAEPQTGDKVFFRMTNKSKERLAVVVRVNGINTLHKEGPERQVEQCTKWVLAAGKSYGIEGFYDEKGTPEKFKVVSPAGLTSLDPQKLGLLEISVFREDKDVEQVGKLNLRGLSMTQNRPATLKELQEMVWAKVAASKKPAFMGLVMPGEKGTTQDIKTVNDFTPVYAGSLTIRYFP